MNPFVLIIAIFFRRLIKILFAPFIFIAIYLFMSKVVEPLIMKLINEITSKYPELQGINEVVGQVLFYLDLFHAINIVITTLLVLVSIKMFSLSLRAFGFGGSN